MIERQFNAPFTSSVGRLFDGVAALAGVRDRVSYEGQAAMELEWLASAVLADGQYPFEIVEAGPDQPLLVDHPAVDCRGGQGGAARSRSRGSLPDGSIRPWWRSWPRSVRGSDRGQGWNVVVLSGGVFLNALLGRETIERLERDGFRVYRHRRVPPSDGGLSLGQLAIAAACDAEGVDRREPDPTVSTT